MTELERRLDAAAREYPFPPTPALTAAVARRLEEAPGRRLRLAGAVAMAVVALGGVLAFSSGARSAVLDWLDAVPGVRIERVERLPASAYLGGFDPGRRVELAEARRVAGFEVRLPRRLGNPAAVYVDRDRSGAPVVTAVFDKELVLTQWPASAVLFHKLVGGDARLERVEVEGERGGWIAGGDHAVFYEPAGSGAEGRVPGRLAGNVLVWERDGIAHRLEADVPLARALDLAASLEP